VSDAHLFIVPSDAAQDVTLAIVCNVVDREQCSTDAEGLLNVRIAEGDYDVRVTGESIAAQSVRRKTLNARNNSLVITVDRAVELSGRVTLDDGTPVAGARVLTRGGREGAKTAIADTRGAFTIKGLSHAPVTVVAFTSDEPPMESPGVEATPPARDVAVVFRKPARLEGRVIDRATSQPITNFSVSVVNRNGPGSGPATAVGNGDGTFVFPRVAPGKLVLHVEAPEYTPATMSEITVEEGKSVNDIEVKLDRGGKLLGRVTAGGKPQAGVRIHRTAPSSYYSRMTMTDANGEFTLDSLPAGEQTFELNKEGFAAMRKTVEIAAGKEARLDVELDRGREVRGRVIDTSGNGIAAAQVMGTGGSTPGGGARTTSGDDGSFVLSGFEEHGRFTVIARKAGYVNAMANDVDPSSGQPLTLTLSRGGTITGRVLGLSDADLQQVDVRASSATSSATAHADAGGAFTISGVSDGRVTVTAYMTGVRMRESASKTIDVVNGTAPPVDIDFSEGISIRGRITRNGTPVSAGSLAFVPHGGSLAGRPANGRIGADGTYEIGGLTPGEYDVRLFLPNANDMRTYTVTANATFDIDLQGGAVRGRVVDAATHTPVSDASVTLTARTPQLARTVMSDFDGRFVLDLVPDGTFEVRATKDHYAMGQQQVVVNGGMAPAIELSITRGEPVTIRVVDGATGATLDAFGNVTGGPKHLSSPVQHADDGALQAWVEPGHYVFNGGARGGYLTAKAEFDVPGPEVRVPLAKGGRLALSSASGGRFILAAAADRMSRGATVQPGATLTIDGLAPGVWNVRKIDDHAKVLKEYVVTIVTSQTATLAAD